MAASDVRGPEPISRAVSDPAISVRAWSLIAAPARWRAQPATIAWSPFFSAPRIPASAPCHWTVTTPEPSVFWPIPALCRRYASSQGSARPGDMFLGHI